MKYFYMFHLSFLLSFAQLHISKSIIWNVLLLHLGLLVANFQSWCHSSRAFSIFLRDTGCLQPSLQTLKNLVNLKPKWCSLCNWVASIGISESLFFLTQSDFWLAMNLVHVKLPLFIFLLLVLVLIIIANSNAMTAWLFFKFLN